MSFTINVHELFLLDVAQARLYYEAISFSTSDKFDHAFEKAYQALVQHPASYFNVSKTIRRLPVPNFPYQIIYTYRKQTISIWCLHHASSNKTEWILRSKR